MNDATPCGHKNMKPFGGPGSSGPPGPGFGSGATEVLESGGFLAYRSGPPLGDRLMVGLQTLTLPI